MSTENEHRDEELGAAINEVEGPGHGSAFWDSVAGRLADGPQLVATRPPRRWIGRGLVGALAAAAVVTIVIVVGGDDESTTLIAPASPTSTEPAPAPSTTASLSTTVSPSTVVPSSPPPGAGPVDVAPGTGVGVVDDQLLVLAVDPDTELENCQRIGPALELRVLTADGTVVETVADITESVRYADGPGDLVAGFTSCEGYPGQLWAEGVDGDVLNLDLPSSGIGLPLDLAWLDAGTLLVVGHLGYEDIAAPYDTRLFSVDVATGAVTDLGDPGIRHVEVLADGSVVRGYADRVEFADGRVLEGAFASMSVAADGLLVAFTTGEPASGSVRVAGELGAGDWFTTITGTDAVDVVGFASDGRTLYYNADPGGGIGVVRRVRSIVPTQRVLCSAGTLESVTNVVEQPYSDLTARIQDAARACALDSLADLAGEITYSFGGGDDFAGHLLDLERRDIRITRQLVLMLERPGTPVIEGSGWAWPAAATVGWDEVTVEMKEELRRLGYTDADLDGFADFGAYIGYRVFISADGEDWQAFVAGD